MKGCVVVLIVALSGCEAEPTQTFLALDRDFAGFQSWVQTALPFDPLSATVDPTGTHVGFLNRPPPPGATAYPVGTILLKAIEPSEDPASWELFGMAKRGTDYNRDGAVGWEFFLLRVATNGNPIVTSRGLAPSDDGSDGGGASYSPGGSAGGCNLCHGSPSYAGHDHVISPPLWPQSN